MFCTLLGLFANGTITSSSGLAWPTSVQSLGARVVGPVDGVVKVAVIVLEPGVWTVAVVLPDGVDVALVVGSSLHETSCKAFTCT